MDLWGLSDLCTPWCVHVVATPRIADRIGAGNTEIDNLAAASGADPDSLRRVLRHLVSKGLFEEPAPGRFALNEVARALLEDQVRLGLDLDGFGCRMAHAWGTLLSAVRRGRPSYHEAFGREFWEDLDAHPDVAASFDALMGPAGHGVPDSLVIVDPADWESARSVVDAGGGTGALLAEILKSVLDDWPDREATAILRRCAETARPSGRVVVVTGARPGEDASPALLMSAARLGEATLDMAKPRRPARPDPGAVPRSCSKPA